MKTSLTLNNKNQIALFYDEPLAIQPQWASFDVDQGEIYIGGDDTGHTAIKLDQIDNRIYERVKSETSILLVRVDKNKNNEPLDTVFVPLMVSQQT